MKRINILLGSIAVLCVLILFFTVPAAVLVGNDLTSEDIRSGLRMNLGWQCLGSPSSLFRIYRSEKQGGDLAGMREKLQLRCFLNRDDDFAQTLSGDDYRELVAKSYHDGLQKALQPAIFDENLRALSVSLYLRGKTVCYFPAVNEWTQCNGRRSCLRGACKHREWLNLMNDTGINGDK